MLVDKRAPSTKWKHLWPLAVCFLWACPTGSAQTNSTINLSKDQARRIGRKIWQNECGGSVAGLTSWNEGENFASLGIGHFIWYPQGVHGPFEESFPKLMKFISGYPIDVPAWVQHSTACPWDSRTEFLRAENSRQMIELRQFLVRTVDLQVQFMVARLQDSLAKMLDEAAPVNRANVRQQFARVASTFQASNTDR